MNREVRYRGKCIDGVRDNQKWVYGYYVQIPCDGHLTDYIYNRESGWHEIISGTQGQYTGKVDSKGVELYEDDVCCVEGKKQNPYKIKFNDSVFMFDDYTSIRHYAVYNIEKIGNDYDNPELIIERVR